MSPTQLTAAVGEMADVLRRGPIGELSQLALIARSFVAWGGSPLPLVPQVAPFIMRKLAQRVTFSNA